MPGAPRCASSHGRRHALSCGALLPRRTAMPAEGSDIQKELNPLENARAQFDEAAQMLEIDPGLLEIIKQPRRSTLVSLPIQMDDGTFRVFTGYRVQHS